MNHSTQPRLTQSRSDKLSRSFVVSYKWRGSALCVFQHFSLCIYDSKNLHTFVISMYKHTCVHMYIYTCIYNVTCIYVYILYNIRIIIFITVYIFAYVCRDAEREKKRRECMRSTPFCAAPRRETQCVDYASRCENTSD